MQMWNETVRNMTRTKVHTLKMLCTELHIFNKMAFGNEPSKSCCVSKYHFLYFQTRRSKETMERL